MERAETSRSKDDSRVRAKLVPTDSAFPSIKIESCEALICSATVNSSDDKHQWCEITWKNDSDIVTLRNLSSNPIIVDGELIEETVVIKSGSEITSGPDKEGYLTYIFEPLPSRGNDKKRIEISLDVEHAKCSICLNIWHDVVTVAPCLHNFCNGCFSEWLRRSSTRSKEGISCPQCRSVVHSVGRNHFLHNLEEAILQKFSSLKRSGEEINLLNKYASIKSNIVLGMPKYPSRKRPHTFSDNGGIEVELPCFQCGSELGGFRCNGTTTHLSCHGCGAKMPSRPDIGVPQNCLGCSRTFCGAYWTTQGLDAQQFNVICPEETFKPVFERTILRIPDSVHRNNRYEKDVTERCIERTGKTLQVLISDLITKFGNKEIDRTNLQLNHPEMITPRTYLCNDCYDKLIDYLLYWFRVSLPSHLLPPDASARENCWYGYLCRTQLHNEEHSRKKNHVCRPTRGTGNM
ncbi:E3 ubiquitin-protein ligase CHFR-like isoform X1 [Zingiber officinale]|uniref:E3 ubiquitin-protein ligase CHFR-like isoform X1 n=1 Tax=Zingiber officinale TaxID=94328 RepID=UPI001C4B0EC8|nr:E3 ubiquitin-protein ligase CHFR-like isoform X1 [Zingiber officinale]